MKLKALLIFLIIPLIWSCEKKAEASSEKEILSFEIEGQTADAIINSELTNIFVEVEPEKELKALIPIIVVSEKASVTPPAGVETDFSNSPVIYTVTAEDNSTKNWEVTVENQKSDKADILSFYMSRQKSEAVFSDTNITVEAKLGTNISSIKPEIEVSPKATINPASGTSVDFTNGPVIYTVTAENGNIQEWLVTIEAEKIYDADILTFSIPDQIRETVFDKNNVYIEVPVGYDLTSVVPEFTITEGTTISPEAGIAVNFAETGFVDFTVTTEINTKKLWRVFVREEVIKPNHKYIQYMGRVDFSDPIKPRLHAAGATILAKFKGTYCQILLDDQVLWGSTQNYLEIVIDGIQKFRVQTTGKTNTIDMVKNLTDGEHTISITKNTEAALGYIDFVGFRCDELLEPEALPERRIEFIGNSITCGYGVDDSQVACGTGQWYDQHSAYYAYGPLTARALNAQWMLSSESGIGLIHSCCDKPIIITDIYETVSLSKTGAAWDFSNYKADVVTICLGQNDGIQDSTQFCSAYVEFIGTIRSKYPNASIICLTSPMADESLFASQKNYLTSVVNYMNNANDNKVYKYFLTHNLVNGCDYHPSKGEHETVANELQIFIKEIMNWE